MSEDQGQGSAPEDTNEQAKPEAEVVDLNFWRETRPPKEDDQGGGGGGGPPPGGDGGDADGVLPTWASHDALVLQVAGKLDGDWHYVGEWGKWYFWNRRLWVRDEVLRVTLPIREVCRWTSGRLEVKSLARHVSSSNTILGIEKLLRSDDRMACGAEVFDANEWLINTPGGIVDLRTGELFPHDKKQLMTQMAGATPEGDCPVWKRFLNELTGRDQAYQDYLQRLVGYSLTGSTTEEIFAFLHGPANTGKSKFVETVRSLHGTYGCASSMDTFIATQNHGHNTQIAKFVGKRLVTAAETDEGCRWDQQRMTTLTGGDEVSANFMRKDEFEYHPQFLLMFHGNHRPRLFSDGGAMRRRLHLLPFLHRPVKIDKHLIDKLKAELGGIMRWAVLGAVLWKQHGLMPPPIVTEATDDYFISEDMLAAWIDERCEMDKSREALTRELYNDYKAWAKAANEYVLSEKRFVNALINLGFRRFMDGRTRKSTFSGIGLRMSNEQLGV
jgi:putative DNA primase/helicase